MKNSDKHNKNLKIYKVLARDFLIDHPVCQCGMKGCTYYATQVHHKRGRIGWLLTEVKYFLAVCYHCHDWIEHHPEEAKFLGYSLSRLKKDQ